MTGASPRPRIGFLGVGWIGLNRMNALAASGHAEVAAVADPNPDMVTAALIEAPDATPVTSLEDLLAFDLDGIVIATPSALHADQAVAALEAGLAVFCQKPLGRSEAEARRVTDAARRADRLLGVDLSYRHTRGMEEVRRLIQSNALGRIFAADLTFHNAYGPDKPWFYDRELAGGGCLMDLGTHLVDLALWTLGFPEVEEVSGRLYAKAQTAGPNDVEDYATVRMLLETGAEVILACSWKLNAGQDADISATFYGENGAARFRNINGSFYDFQAEHLVGTERRSLVEPPDLWGGRGIVEWGEQLAAGNKFDPEIEKHLRAMQVLDHVYRAHAR